MFLDVEDDSDTSKCPRCGDVEFVEEVEGGSHTSQRGLEPGVCLFYSLAYCCADCRSVLCVRFGASVVSPEAHDFGFESHEPCVCSSCSVGEAEATGRNTLSRQASKRQGLNNQQPALD